MYYVLDGHEPVEATYDEWSRWTHEHYSDGVAVVGYTSAEDIRVSTVFLGLDLSIGKNGAPRVFETMIFAPSMAELDERQARYATWDEAKKGHDETVGLVEMVLREGARR